MNGDERFHLIRHKFWHQKSQFAIDTDLYDYWTIFALEEGRFEYAIDDHKGIAEPGDAVVCPPGSWFGRVMLEPLSFHFFQFHYEPQYNPDSFPFGNVLFTFRDRIRFESTAHSLRNGILSRTEYKNLWKEQLLNDLKTQLEMEWFISKSMPTSPPDPLMTRAAEAIKDYYASDLQLRSVAETLGITPVQLTRRFRSEYGMTPTDFVIDLRLKQACQLLTESKLSIDDIAQYCGYENGFYLSRIFLKKIGMRPSEYRKRHQV